MSSGAHSAGEDSHASHSKRPKRVAMDASTARSSQKSKRKGIPATAALRTTSGLAHENTTVLALNCRGFHQSLQLFDLDATIGNFEQAVTTVMKEVVEHKGVVDTFNGDRFFATFNAVRPCPSHPRRAVGAARCIINSLSNRAFQAPIVATIATGRCQVGNVGCDHMKKFNIIGHAVSQVAYYERLSRLYPAATCIVADRVLPDIASHHHYKVLDIVRAPFASHPVVIADVVGEINSEASGEWLYVVSEKDPAAQLQQKLNQIFHLVHDGKIGDAAHALEQLPESDRDPILERLVHAGAQSDTVGAIASDYGQLYQALVRPSRAKSLAKPRAPRKVSLPFDQ